MIRLNLLLILLVVLILLFGLNLLFFTLLLSLVLLIFVLLLRLISCIFTIIWLDLLVLVIILLFMILIFKEFSFDIHYFFYVLLFELTIFFVSIVHCIQNIFNGHIFLPNGPKELGDSIIHFLVYLLHIISFLQEFRRMMSWHGLITSCISSLLILGTRLNHLRLTLCILYLIRVLIMVSFLLVLCSSILTCRGFLLILL